MLIMVRTLRRLLGMAWLVAVIGLIGLGALTHLVDTVVLRGDSMSPALPLGSLAVMEQIAPDALRPGDVVSVRADNGVLVTHRITRIEEVNGDGYLELRGDANPSPDPVLVPVRAVVGRVSVSLPYIGYVVFMIGTLPGLLAVGSGLVCGAAGLWLLEDWEAQLARSVLPSLRSAPARPATAARPGGPTTAKGTAGGSST